MSYCRWSSDNMRSDVYAYENVMGGYTIHVRSVHPVNPEILPEFPEEITGEALFKWQKERNDAIGNLVYKNIELQYDAHTISVESIKELYDFLRELKRIGYYIPSVTFDMIDEEIHEED